MKKQFILGLGLLIFGTLQAQETGSYLHFNVGGGLHNLSYNLNDGTQKGMFGYTINAGYSYFFTPHWGLQTGVGFQSFNSLSTLNYLSKTPDIDSDGKAYEFNANYKSLQEHQQALFVDIPLELQFRLPVTPKFRILTSAGAKISFPVNTSFNTTGGELVTTGFYSQYNAVLSDLPQHGFSTYTDFKGNYTLKTAYIAIGDLGGLYKLSEKVDLYVGGYINYGLNNVLTPDTKLIYQPLSSVQPNQQTGVYNGIFTSNQTDYVRPIAFGVKVGLYWQLGERKSVAGVEHSAQTIQPVRPNETLQPTKTDDSAKPTLELLDSKVGEIPTEPVKPENNVTEPSANPDSIISEPTLKPLKSDSAISETSVVPLKNDAITEPTIKDQTPKVTETPQELPKAQTDSIKENPKEIIKPNESPRESTKEVIVEPTVKPASHVGTDQNEDPYERAKKIAANMNLMFGFNSYKVGKTKNDNINELSDILKANPYIHLRFVGHTCNIGTHQVNLLIGMKRAVNVKQKFIEHGVSKSQLISESKSFDQPLVPNTSKANRARNRRVEIKVFKKGM